MHSSRSLSRRRGARPPRRGHDHLETARDQERARYIELLEKTVKGMKAEHLFEIAKKKAFYEVRIIIEVFAKKKAFYEVRIIIEVFLRIHYSDERTAAGALFQNLANEMIDPPGRGSPHSGTLKTDVYERFKEISRMLNVPLLENTELKMHDFIHQLQHVYLRENQKHHGAELAGQRALFGGRGIMCGGESAQNQLLHGLVFSWLLRDTAVSDKAVEVKVMNKYWTAVAGRGMGWSLLVRDRPQCELQPLTLSLTLPLSQARNGTGTWRRQRSRSRVHGFTFVQLSSTSTLSAIPPRPLCPYNINIITRPRPGLPCPQ
jgi:hypothetical protein